MDLQLLEGNGQQNERKVPLLWEPMWKVARKHAGERGREERSRKTVVLLLKEEVELSIFSQTLCITGVSAEAGCLSIPS